MADSTRLERWLDRLIARAENPRKAAFVIGSVTTTVTLAAGLAMTVVDHDGFPTVGSGLWWAVQTVTTVGYGDRVPETVAGQLMAAVVMLLGIGFVTVIVASIVSAFVAEDEDLPLSAAQLDDILARIERIEARITPPA
jgi:voltage-gated potassium channel